MRQIYKTRTKRTERSLEDVEDALRELKRHDGVREHSRKLDAAVQALLDAIDEEL